MDKLVLTLKDQCKFHLGDVPDAWQAWYEDSDWTDVTLPHDWAVTLPFSREYSSGTGYLAGGIGWYRLRIAPREEWRGKRIRISFNGVYKNSRVWCNSYYLGQRPNGYISFSYDITEQFRFDQENIICVRVDHQDISDSRWFTGSGITRKVSLIVEEAVHPVENGIFFQTPRVDEEEAEALIQNELINQSGQEAQVTVTSRLLLLKTEGMMTRALTQVSTDGDTVAMATPSYSSITDGACAAASSAVLTLAPGQTGLAETRMKISSPLLWSWGTPHLYLLQTWLTCRLADGTVTESLADVQRVGIRSFHFDPDHGLFLNGRPALLKGVCVHHDAGCLGAAVLPSVWRRRLEKLKKMGCNALRMSHNPHMPELYDLCDEMGFLVMDEAFDEWEGPKNKWWQGHNVYPPRHQGYYVEFPQWHRQDLTDLVRRDRNHPSILLWSIGNEIDYPNDPYCHPSFSDMTGNNDANKPLRERRYNPLRPNAERLAPLAAQLTAIVKESDSTRPVTLATAFPELSSHLGFLDPLDVAGYNYKEHLYEESHKRFPDKPFLGSENGHGLASWQAVTDKEYIAGQFLWTGIDYLGEAHGWPIHGSGAGLLTLAGFEKPGYYRRQSFWSEEPMLHLTTVRAAEDHGEYARVSETWNYLPGEEIRIKCYTNLPEVAFFLNGKELGRARREEGEDCIRLTVPFAPGTLEARGTLESKAALKAGELPEQEKAPLEGEGNQENGNLLKTEEFSGQEKTPLESEGSILRDTLSTTGCACQIQLSCWEEERAREDGLYQVEATLADYQGRRVFSDNTLLFVKVQNGRLLGLENGDLADTTDYASHSRRAYRGQLLIYVAPTDPENPPVVTVAGDMVRAAQISL